MKCSAERTSGLVASKTYLVEAYKLVAAQESVGLGSRGGGLTRVGLDEELSIVFLSEILVLVT